MLHELGRKIWRCRKKYVLTTTAICAIKNSQDLQLNSTSNKLGTETCMEEERLVDANARGGRTYDVNKSAPASVGAATANEVARLSRSLIFNLVL